MNPFAEDIVGVIAGGLIGFLAAVFAEPLRQRLFKPKLRLEFGGGPDYFTYTPEGAGEERHEAIYLRVKVANESPFIARDCRAYLVNIEKKDEHGKFKRTIYADSMPLAWSGRKPNEVYDPIDIPKDVPQYFNILATKSISHEFHPLIMVVPYRYGELFKETGTFRFTVQVSAQGGHSKRFKLTFNWRGLWDDFDANSLESKEFATKGRLEGSSHEDSRV